jgi:hypothetical protein
MRQKSPLKLRAADAEDLAILSAVLQDAVIAIREAKFLPAENRFAFVANRFRWEESDRTNAAEGAAIYERVHCGVCFENVTAVRQRGLVQERRGQIVSLLSIEPGEGYVDLHFSAGIVIRLEVENVLCHLQDLDEPWPTQWRPTHPLDD